LSEILGPGVACECDAEQNGLHGWEDHFLFEIDPVAEIVIGKMRCGVGFLERRRDSYAAADWDRHRIELTVLLGH
jgi:hypothetical protein